MSTRGEIPVDFASVQSTRASCTASLTKALDQLNAIPASTSEEVSLMNTEDVDWVLNSILNTESTFLQSMDDGQLFIPEEDEEDFQLEEDLAEESFNDFIYDINYRGKQLLCMKAVTNGLASFYSDLEAIQATLNSSPETNMVSDLNELTTLHSSLRDQWQTVNLPENHPIKQELHSCKHSLWVVGSEVYTSIHKSNIQRLQRLKEATLYPELPPLPPLADILDCHLEVVAEPNTEHSHQQQKSQVYSASLTSFPAYKWNCALCRPERHPLHICPKWLNYTIEQRVSYVSSKKLCANCLAVGHLTAACRSKYRCRSCGQAHHTTIHQDVPDPAHSSSILTQPQQLPDALLMAAEVPSKEPEEQHLKNRASITPDAGLSSTSIRTTQILKLPIHLTSTTTLSLHNKQNIQCRPAALQPATESNLSQQLVPVEEDVLLLDLQPADTTFYPAPNIPPASEPGVQDTTPGWTVTGTAKPQGIPQQGFPTQHLQSNFSTNISHNLASDSRLASTLHSDARLADLTEELELQSCSVQTHLNHSHSNPVTVSLSNCRHQTTLPENSDCQPPGEDSSQAVFPKMALSQQLCEKGQNNQSIRRDGLQCLSLNNLPPSMLIDADSIVPELHEFSHSLQNCATVVHPRATSKEQSPTPFLATSKPSSWTSMPTAEYSTVCANTELVHHKELPLPSEDPGPIFQQPPQKELPNSLHSATSKQPPQKELLKPSIPAHSTQPPQKELLELPLELPTSVLELPIPVLELPNPVDISTTLSTTATNLASPLLTNYHISSYTDWCWKFCSTLSYKGAPPSAATNCLPLIISNPQNPAASSMPNPTGAEKKTAETWLLQQARIQLYSFKKAYIRKKRFFSKSSRLMPWHPNLDSSQTLTAGRLPTNLNVHSLQQHQLLADATSYSVYDWLKHFSLTLCHSDFILFCTTDAKFILLSARRLSRLVFSNSQWRTQPHPLNQLMEEISALPGNIIFPFLYIRMDPANPSISRKGKLQLQPTAASDTALQGITPRSNLRQLHQSPSTENGHYFIQLNLTKFSIRWLHIPAETLQFRSPWKHSINSSTTHFRQILDPVLLNLEDSTSNSTSLIHQTNSLDPTIFKQNTLPNSSQTKPLHLWLNHSQPFNVGDQPTEFNLLHSLLAQARDLFIQYLSQYLHLTLCHWFLDHLWTIPNQTLLSNRCHIGFPRENVQARMTFS